MSDTEFRSGDTVKVNTKIVEGGKTRTQIFPGIIIAVKKNSGRLTFTVRRRGKDGIFVERIFPYPSPWIEDVQVIKKGKVRRAKLYFLRKKQFATKTKYLQMV